VKRPQAKKPRFASGQPKPVKVFVSHSSIDTWVARQIASAIREAGAAVFLDAVDIVHGDDFKARIQRETSECTEMLVLLTPWALKRPSVWTELGAFWGGGKRIVVALHGISARNLMSRESTPAFLKVTDMVDINDLDDYFGQLKKRSSETS
jgi:hypothetical protein